MNLSGQTVDSSSTFIVSDIDIPLHVGFNVLTFTDRFLTLRIFIGTVLSFVLAVDEGSMAGFNKDTAKNFIM